MAAFFVSLFALIRLSPARRILIYQRILTLATAIGFKRLVEYASRALAHETRTHALQQERQAKRGNLYAVPVKPIDIRADTLLSGFRSLAVGLATGLPDDHPISIAVTEVLEGIFPNGVGAVTSLQYVEQVAAMEHIVLKLRTTYAPQVAFLGMEDKVRLIAEVTEEYRRAVNSGRESYDSSELKAADERGHLYLVEIVGMIVGKFFDSDNPEHVATREKLLAPVYEQVEEVRTKRRARRDSGDSRDDDILDTDAPGREPGTDDDMIVVAATDAAAEQ